VVACKGSGQPRTLEVAGWQEVSLLYLPDSGEKPLTQQIFEAINDLPPEWVVVILSALPISEVRGGIPAGLWLLGSAALPKILLLAIVSNVISVIPVVLGFNWVAQRLADKPVLGRLITRLIRRARSKEEMVNRHGVWAVTLFVAIPLPVTGAWTGSLVAAVFGMRFWRVLFCLTVGVMIASTIVTSLTVAGVHIFSALAAVP